MFDLQINVFLPPPRRLQTSQETKTFVLCRQEICKINFERFKTLRLQQLVGDLNTLNVQVVYSQRSSGLLLLQDHTYHRSLVQFTVVPGSCRDHGRLRASLANLL